MWSDNVRGFRAPEFEYDQFRNARPRPPWIKTHASRRADPTELETRFQSLVQSPLRAGLLRFLHARPEESFDIEALMQTFGRMRLDIENCLRELVAFGVTHKIDGAPPKFAFRRPESETVRNLLDEFLERRATVSHEDRSPAVQRFREMIGRDEKMLVVFEWIRTAAKSDISVLILGPVFYLTRSPRGTFVPYMRGQGLLKLDRFERVVGSPVTLEQIRRVAASPVGTPR